MNMDTSSSPKEQITKKMSNILEEDVELPAACLNKRHIESNIKWMQDFLSHYSGMKIAPHGKTTMCPKLFHQQLQAESTWGITLATATQVKVAHQYGVKNILLANQLVGKRNIEIIQEIIASDPTFEFLCIVDSIENIRQLGTCFRARNQSLQVLLEIGIENGRTGIRNETELHCIFDVLKNWTGTIELVGLEFFEGILESAEEARSFIKSHIPSALQNSSSFAKKEVIVSGAGSDYFDIVAEELSKIELPEHLQAKGHTLSVIIRPGCYITQDVGTKELAHLRMKQSSPVISRMNSSLEPALQVWGYVQSKPEPGVVIVALGKRNVSFDAGLPKPAMYFRPGEKGAEVKVGQKVETQVNFRPTDIRGKGWTVTKLMDQHAFMKVDLTSHQEIRVGDMVSVDILHPCTTFDKWRNVLLIDDDFNVVDVLETYF